MLPEKAGEGNEMLKKMKSQLQGPIPQVVWQFSISPTFPSHTLIESKSVHPAPVLQDGNAEPPLSPLSWRALCCFTRPGTCPLNMDVLRFPPLPCCLL